MLKVNALSGHGKLNTRLDFSPKFEKIPTVKITKNADEAALSILGKKMHKGIPELTAQEWSNWFKGFCEKLKIKPRNLPIDETHKGNLTPEQTGKLISEIYKVYNLG